MDAGGSSCSVTFDWHPYVNETVTLEVVADYLDAVNESEEGNNASTMNVNVLATGQADLDMRDEDLALLPSWKSNDTTIQITVTNLGTDDADNFVAKAYNGTTEIYTSPTMSVAAKGGKIISCMLDAPHGGPYPTTVVLDANSNVDESNEGNNERTKQLNVIEVMLWDSHHHGNTSTYNGEYSNDNSVVVVTPQFGPDFEIDGLIEDPSGPIYWYLYFNGRYTPKDSWSVIKLLDGETMHWDFQKQIYTESDSFTPPCTVQSYVAGDDLYPEPFTHGFPMGLGSGDGYSRTVWNTVIVYPAGSTDFASIADDIKNTLVAGGVPTEQISVTDDASVGGLKDNSNLILIGSYTANSLIADVNASHEDIGMPAYFDYTSCAIIEDDDDSTTPPQSYDHGAVVEAFDNPWNNGALVDHAGSVIFMASGLNDGDAKDAANMLLSETDELNRFWRVKVTTCGDVDCSGLIRYLDVFKLKKHYSDPSYPITCKWAGDVDCSGLIRYLDVFKLKKHYSDPSYGIDCCKGCVA
jgi:hypothetical protein